MAHMQTMLDERSAADEAASHGANYFQQGSQLINSLIQRS